MHKAVFARAALRVSLLCVVLWPALLQAEGGSAVHPPSLFTSATPSANQSRDSIAGLIVQTGHTSPVNSITMSPDGSLLDAARYYSLLIPFESVRSRE